jgi:glycosyltransferase involved in cell wall biosynthesis
VSVVVTLFNYAHTIADALRSVALSDLDEVELVLVDDASTDDSLAVARAALEELPWLRGRVIARGANGGLAAARNLGIEHALGEYVFVLDADNTVGRSGLRLLASALDASPDASFAYGLIQAVGPSGPMGLLSWAPWDPWWLRIDNYIDAMALLRRSAVVDVGGYTTTESLYGWEDFELWCNMASRGMSGVLVPEVVASYRAGRQSMISLTTLDTTDAWSDLLDRYEFLT